MSSTNQTADHTNSCNRPSVRVRQAQTKDIPRLQALLQQVAAVHHAIRPDLFRAGRQKYDTEQLHHLLADTSTPIFVAVDESDTTLGYAFCQLIRHTDNNVLTDILTLHIDDLCVDETKRGMRIGRSLYDFVISYARNLHCYNVTLNVWSGNDNAMHFYELCGLKPQKIGMETIL